MKKKIIILLNFLFLGSLTSFSQVLSERESGNTIQNPVIIPGTLSGPEFNLTLQNGTFQFYDGINTTTMGVNGNILGPTLIMHKGDNVNIHVNNNLNETTTIHWHGMHVSAENDGGPHTTIAPGASWNPHFTVLDKAGTYWYHPHLHEKTNEHISKGIAGFIIVQDSEEAALDLPRTYGVDDFPLVIQTKDFDAQKEIVAPSNSDDVVMVNATIAPSLAVPAQVIRFRLLNGSSMRVFNIGLSGNETFYQIGSDGGLLSEPLPLTRLQMAPGERAEILINFNGKEGQQLNLMSYASEFQDGIYGATYPGMMTMMTLHGYNPNPLNGNDFNVITFNVVAPGENPVTNIPLALVEVTPISEATADLTRNLTFTPEIMGPNQLNGNFLINGTSFNMDVINYLIPLNNTEIWRITNQSAIAHPFHIHDVQFYVLDRNGEPPLASELGRKDVILIKPQETVRFITRFEDFANDSVPYMFHCHMLMHEDGGMMLQFKVVDETSGIVDNMTDSEDFISYPNPLTEHNSILNFKAVNDINSYVVYDIIGRRLIEKKTDRNISALSIDFTDFDKGTYILSVRTDNKTLTTKVSRE